MHLESAWRCCCVAVLLCVAACASGPRADRANAPREADPPAVASGSTPPAETLVASPAVDDADAGAAEETPKDCNFRVKGFCFKTDEEACAAAGCDAANCMILESYPARVKCRE